MPKQAKQGQSSLNHTLVGPRAPLPTAHAIKGPNGEFILSDKEDRAVALLDLALALVDSALGILDEHIISDAQLRRDSVLMPGGSLGKHFRHVIETFQAFLLPLLHLPAPVHTSESGSVAGTSSQHSPSEIEPLEINYDAILPTSRRPVARSLHACQSAMRDVRRGLAKWGEDSVSEKNAPIRTGETSRDGPGLAWQMERPVRLVAVTPTKQEAMSSVGRELWFCCLHAIHHFSMLRTIAVHELGIKMPVEFGTAPSTILYRGDKWTPPDETRFKLVKSKL